eukprot:6468734-Amphidinium_carterae.1
MHNSLAFATVPPLVLSNAAASAEPVLTLQVLGCARLTRMNINNRSTHGRTCGIHIVLEPITRPL